MQERGVEPQITVVFTIKNAVLASLNSVCPCLIRYDFYHNRP